MKHLRRILARLYLLFANSRVEAELEREIGAHLALLEDEYLRQGMTPEQARRAARIACGGVEQAKQLSGEERTAALVALLDSQLAGEPAVVQMVHRLSQEFALAEPQSDTMNTGSAA